MNLWTRRLGLFLLVFATGLLGLQVARRWTAHASMRVSSGTGRSMPVLAQPLRAARSLHASASARRAADVDTAAAQPSHSTAVLSAEGPRITPPAGNRGIAAVLQPPQKTRTFHDPNYKVSFDYPANWTFTQKDGEISTFRLDARSATRKTSLRAVAALPANPYPASTFSGGYVYLSVTPHSSARRCAAQAVPSHKGKPATRQIAGLNFAHGHDEQKEICTIERDEIYTTLHKGACYRFDLAMNNFCGGEVSGVKDVTQEELDTVLSRLESIVQTVRFDPR